MEVEILVKPYGPDSTPEECEALRRRVTLVEPRMILLREIPIQTGFSIDLIFDAVLDVTKDFKQFACIVDLTEAQIPSAEHRAYLRERIQAFQDRIVHTALFTGRNFLLNVAAKFVVASQGHRSYSIHKTYEEALKEAKRVLDQTGKAD